MNADQPEAGGPGRDGRREWPKTDLTDSFPLPDAAPAPGCTRCAQMADDRTAARAAGDYSAVSDANVLIRRHPGH
ncbi:hypothetical protein O7599_27515 [Streptomyces sp. WMMC500]|uniref:hypothetical protein n=1 Tax=Streptomyces sp. WMMC500 TaxID=3015154 RepID=UPI00248B5FFB|nr:hypothetical protein [Streptomyces sp. WMMC500]WBB59298.1 hypothetical protein O7599_27515 [Streptomyces sp. WMMC500]